MSAPKPFSFPLQQSFSANPCLISATFPLIILTGFPQNLVSYPQQIFTDLPSHISTISHELLLRVFTITLQTCKCLNLFSSVVHV